MKRFTNMLILIIVFALISVVSYADTPILKATLTKYEPTPAQAGDYVTVYVKIENAGTDKANNARLEFVDNYPFSLDNENDRIIEIGTLNSGASYLASFKVRVDEKAVVGANKLKVKFNDNYPSSSYTEKEFNVNIQIRFADIAIENIQLVPSQIQPGQNADVSITIKNMGESPLTDISIQLLTVAVQGSTVVDLPFAIEGAVSRKSLDILDSAKTSTLKYNVKSYPTITPGIYKLPIRISFFDGTGQNYTVTDYITLIVNPDSKLSISIDSSTLTQAMMTGDVTIKIINKGFGEVKFANLKLIESEDYELLTPYSDIYIGNIDSDDYDTADIRIKANTDEIKIPVELQYSDSLNNEYTLQKTLNLKVYSLSELGVQKSNTGLYAVIIIVIGVAGYFIYRKTRHNKK